MSQIQRTPGCMVVPSSESLMAQIDSAMRRFDCDRDQADMRRAERGNARMERVIAAEITSRGRIARWGV